MRMRTTIGQHPDDVVVAAVNQVHRHMGKPETRIMVLESLKPYMEGTGHSDMNGMRMPAVLHKWARNGFTFVREPAGPQFAGEVVQSLPLTLRTRAGDCDDLATLVATAAATLGLETAIGAIFTNPQGTNAHIVAAVREGWYSPKGRWWVVDPQAKKPADPAEYNGIRWLRV